MSLRRLHASWICLLVSACAPDTSWRAAPEADADGWLMNVWGPSEEHLFAVGGAPDDGLVLELRDGAAREIALPPDVPLVNWAFGFGADDVMFAANEGHMLHYDGESVERLETPTEEHLWGVWGAAPDDVWAVGGFRSRDSRPVILHWDGAVWTESPVPTIDREANALFKVWGSGPDDVYAVGHRGLVLHWDSVAWTQVEVGAGDDLIAVWGVGPDRVVLVGGRSNGIVSRWDGVSWRTEVLGPVAGLNGVWLRSPDAAHAVGPFGGLITVDLTDMSHEEQSAGMEARTFHSVFGVGEELIAVGGTIGSPTTFEGMAYRRALAAHE